MTNLLVLLDAILKKHPATTKRTLSTVSSDAVENVSQLRTAMGFYQFSRELSIGKSQFYKLYQQFFIPRPKKIYCKLGFKSFYLRSNKTLTIREAAFQSGFQNINHFNRLFANAMAVHRQYQQEQ